MEQLIGIAMLLSAFSGSASDKPVAAALQDRPVVPEIEEKGPRVVAGFLTPPRIASPEELEAARVGNWCKPGHLVMIPDGREGRVTSIDGPLCRVLAYGEGYVSLWTYDLVEPIYPQELPVRAFGH